MNIPSSRIITLGTTLLISSLANADIITVTIEGSMQNIDDPTNYFQGGDRWSASIDIDTDSTMTSVHSNYTEYSGNATYSLGGRAPIAVAAELRVLDSDPNDPDFPIDGLAVMISGIGLNASGFFALDLGGNLFNSADLPPLGLTFADGFTPGVVGTDYENPSNGAFAELVADTVSVVPTPSSAMLLSIAGITLTKRRR